MSFKLILINFIVFSTLLITGCDKNESTKTSDKETAQSNSGEDRDINNITIRPELANRLKIGQPALIDLADKILVPSRVQVDEERTAQIGSYVTGRIINLFVILGDYVQAGAPFCLLYTSRCV